MKVAGAAQVGVLHDGGGFGGMSVGFVGGDERGDGLAGQAADLDGTRRHSLGALPGKITIEAQDAEACSEALFGMRPAGEDGGDQPSVSGPIDAAQRRKRSGVHSAYRRCELGM